MARKTSVSTIDRIRRSPKVEIVDDERSSGNGVIVTLRAGWTFDPGQDNRVAGEDTASAAMKLLGRATSYSGPLER